MQAWIGQGFAFELERYLLLVVAVDVAVATCPDEVAHIKATLLRDHVREQRVAGNIKRFSGYAALYTFHYDCPVFRECLDLTEDRTAP